MDVLMGDKKASKKEEQLKKKRKRKRRGKESGRNRKLSERGDEEKRIAFELLRRVLTNYDARKH